MFLDCSHTISYENCARQEPVFLVGGRYKMMWVFASLNIMSFELKFDMIFSLRPCMFEK